MSSNLFKAQEKLYIWLNNFDRRSYELIRQNCNYLNDQYELGIKNYTVWKVFYPLVYNGVVDYCGDGYYSVTEPLSIDFGSHYVFINPMEDDNLEETSLIGIFWGNKQSQRDDTRTIKVNPLMTLRSFPTIREIVDSFSISYIDNDKLNYHNYKTQNGVADLKDGGLIRYFSIPTEGYQREIPDKIINPDALNISYCFERVVNKEENGRYFRKDKVLVMKSFGLPIMIYRCLLLDSLSRKEIPELRKNEYYFKNINHRLVRELNKIFCNTISIYE